MPEPLPRLAILCPCYNEEGIVRLFFERLLPVMHELSSRYRVDLVFLNNASTDRTLAEILALRALWGNVYVLTMSRNVGYQRSIECGLRNARGDLFVIIDIDGEDPPELIPEFVRKFEEGFDIVYGERVDREEPTAIKRMRKYFYRLLKRVADEEIVLDMAEFALLSAEVRDAIAQDSSSFPFVRASIGRVGFRRYGIPFKRQKRIGGRSHYNLPGMTLFAVAGILSSSTLFLRLPIYSLPFWLASVAGLIILYVSTGALWAAAAAAILYAAYVGTALAFMSLYVARSYKDGLRRPNALIDHRDTHAQDRPAEEPHGPRLDSAQEPHATGH